ncbi:MAG: hypothetical protein FJ316_10040 [SAR202 cluster bacterium]|nr:hypothetical protein [SAR202 cluster bacterium]
MAQAQEPDRPLAEDLACPVEVEPGRDAATPEGWEWRRIGTSQPNMATFHISHADVTQVMVDVLRPADAPADSPFIPKQDIPILIIDSLDQYWAGEAGSALPLQGLRVPVAADTVAEAKAKLAADLAAQLRLLVLLSSSREGQMAPQLKHNLQVLAQNFVPREGG